MRKQLLTVILITISAITYAQWLGGTTSTANIYRTGNVGIGLSTAPSYNLVVNHPTAGNGARVILGGNVQKTTSGTSESILEIQNNYLSGGSFLQMYAGNSAANTVGLFLSCSNAFGTNIISGRLSGGTVAYQDLKFFTGGSANPILTLKNDGNKVVIGNPSSLPSTYNLYVTGGILTEKLKVAISGTADWSDYVFAEDYTLMPIYFLEKYITENNHLPGVPSAEEMVNIGNDVAKTDAILLAKIEELTLYMIAQQKQELVSLKRESIFLV